MWVAVTETDAKAAGLTGPELSAARTAAAAAGVADTFEYVRDRVVREVRGRVKACARNSVLGEDGTIPDECLEHALALLVARLARRIPGKVLLTEERRDAERDALAFFRDVADCKVVIEPPETAGDETSAAPRAEVIDVPTRRTGRCRNAGL